MNDEQLSRYSRHILLPEIDSQGQHTLCASKVLIIGLGGLGSPAIMYLAASGIGHLTLCDDDNVELSNLQRQIAHTTADIGRTKVESAHNTIRELNPHTSIETIDRKLDWDALLIQVEKNHIVVDATDNFTSRFLINKACFMTNTPLVSGAAIGLEGQVSVFDPRQANSPCYHCLYAEQPEKSENCSEYGVLAPLAGIVASIQATEVIKLLLSIGLSLVGRLLLINAKTMDIRTVTLPRDPLCAVCSKNNSHRIAS